MQTQELTASQLSQKKWTEKRLKSYGFSDLKRIERKLADHDIEVPGELNRINVAKAIAVWDDSADDVADENELLAELGRMALDHLDRVAEEAS